MVIDSSALIAILAREPEARRLVRALANDSVLLLSAATLVETSIVASTRFGDEIVDTLELFLATLDVEIVPFTAQQATIARRTSPLREGDTPRRAQSSAIASPTPSRKTAANRSSSKATTSPAPISSRCRTDHTAHPRGGR